PSHEPECAPSLWSDPPFRRIHLPQLDTRLSFDQQGGSKSSPRMARAPQVNPASAARLCVLVPIALVLRGRQQRFRDLLALGPNANCYSPWRVAGPVTERSRRLQDSREQPKAGLP